MNAAILAALASLISLLATIIGGAFVYGKLTQKVKGHDEKFAEHDKQFILNDGKFEQVAGRLESHGNDIARLQEWKNGYNAAASVHSNNHV